MTTTREIPAPWSSDRFLTEMTGQVLTAHADAKGIVVVHRSSRGRAFVGVGEPRAIAGHLTHLADMPFVHGSMIRGTWEHLPADVRQELALPVAEDWDWLEIDYVPEVAGTETVRELDPVSDRAELLRVKDAAIPDSYLQVDSPGTRWFGWADEVGRIRAIGGATGWDGTRWPTGAHFGSIGTEPEWQGRGIGAALTTGMIAIAFAEGAERASLGVYPANIRAMALYRRLGFRLVYEIHSRRRA